MNALPDAKEFATLAACFAMRGHALRREVGPDGAARYYVARWGFTKTLADIEEARAFLIQIGGG